MIAVIRIHGRVKIQEEIEGTLSRLRLRKKLVCVLIDEKDQVKMGMLKKVRDYVAYGVIDNKLVEKLVEKRGELNSELKKEKSKAKKTLENIKPFFRLHPPRGGFRKSTKQHAPKGILGSHEDISKLLERML